MKSELNSDEKNVLVGDERDVFKKRRSNERDRDEDSSKRKVWLVD